MDRFPQIDDVRVDLDVVKYTMWDEIMLNFYERAVVHARSVFKSLITHNAFVFTS